MTDTSFVFKKALFYWRYCSWQRAFPTRKQMLRARMTSHSVSPLSRTTAAAAPRQQLEWLVRSEKESLNASDQIVTCHYQLGERLFAAAPGPITLRSSPSSSPPSAVDDSHLDALQCACVQMLRGWGLGRGGALSCVTSNDRLADGASKMRYVSIGWYMTSAGRDF